MNRTRFARTLDEAFPFGPEYGCAITRYSRSYKVADMALYVVAILAVIVLMVVL